MLAGNGAELSAELQDALFELTGLFGRGALLGGDCGAADFVLDSDFDVNHLVGKGADAVVEAEAVFANVLCGEDKVALALLCAVEDDLLFARLATGAVDCIIDWTGGVREADEGGRRRNLGERGGGWVEMVGRRRRRRRHTIEGASGLDLRGKC